MKKIAEELLQYLCELGYNKSDSSTEGLDVSENEELLNLTPPSHYSSSFEVNSDVRNFFQTEGFTLKEEGGIFNASKGDEHYHVSITALLIPAFALFGSETGNAKISLSVIEPTEQKSLR